MQWFLLFAVQITADVTTAELQRQVREMAAERQMMNWIQIAVGCVSLIGSAVYVAFKLGKMENKLEFHFKALEKIGSTVEKTITAQAAEQRAQDQTLATHETQLSLLNVQIGHLEQQIYATNAQVLDGPQGERASGILRRGRNSG